MTKKVTLALAVFSLILVGNLSAQNVYFSGTGRALVANDNLSDDTDPASRLKASGGYTLFDLGIYASPNEVLRGGVVLRTKNQFGGFYQDGSKLEFRQMLLEGVIAKKVKYEIGDVYFTHTKYTLWNSEPISNKYESNAFGLRRDIVNYENFYVGNAWRMQGVNAKGKVNFSKGIESIGIRAYGGKTQETDFNTIPNRYFYGGKVDLKQGKYFRIAGNFAGITDITGTVEDTSISYDNIVYTTDFEFTLDKSEKVKFALKGEAGTSSLMYKRAVDSVSNNFKDYFYDFGAEATYKPFNLTLSASYRDVGFNFNSPMAQTRRWGAPNTVALTTFPTLNDGVSKRSFTLFDSYSQESGLYNQSISPPLMKYDVRYTMVEPYGRATPNRKGFTFGAEIKTPSELIKAGIEANLLSEGVSEGDSVTQEKRDFTLIRGGLIFNVSKLIEWEKTVAISAGIRTESSKRGGANPLSLSSSLLDLGLDVEVIKDLHLLGGYKMFSVKGMEFESERDNLNQIVSYTTGTNFNETQGIIASGLRYDYGTNGYFSMQYQFVNYEDKIAALNKFDLSQMFFVFGLKF